MFTPLDPLLSEQLWSLCPKDFHPKEDESDPKLPLRAISSFYSQKPGGSVLYCDGLCKFILPSGFEKCLRSLNKAVQHTPPRYVG